jgi:hypothetical protein
MWVKSLDSTLTGDKSPTHHGVNERYCLLTSRIPARSSSLTQALKRTSNDRPNEQGYREIADRALGFGFLQENHIRVVMEADHGDAFAVG